MQMPRSELIIVEQPSGGHKTPRYQTEEMHYEWRFERLARYCARPPIAMERLEPLADGRLLYRFKRPWRDGTTHVVFEPLELLEKLVAIIPAPKAHLVRYAGILGPAAKWRALIVPAGPAAGSAPVLDLHATSATPLCAPESSLGTAGSLAGPASPQSRPVDMGETIHGLN